MLGGNFLLIAWKGTLTGCLGKLWLPHRGIQGHVGWDPGQSNLVGGSPVMAVGWNLMIFKLPSKPSHCILQVSNMIL